MGLETGDDIVIGGEGVRPTREQDKNTIGENSPLTDRSVPLWKTLAIWTKAERSGQLLATSCLLLCTNRAVPRNSLVVRLAEAKSDDELDRCIGELKDIAHKSSASISLYCAEISRDWTTVREVIKRLSLCDASEFDPALAAAEVADRLHIPDGIDYQHIADGLAGWLHRLCYDHWQRRQPALIPRSAFDNQYHAILDLLRRRRILERPAWDIPLATSERDAARSEFFFEQLIAIKLNDEGLEAAVDNYLRFRTERLRLSAEGDLTADDWKTFFSALVERWSRIRRRSSSGPCSDDVGLGRTIYDETVENGHRELLAGAPTQGEYMTSGGYHRLADDSHVSWHPRYGSTRKREE